MRVPLQDVVRGGHSIVAEHMLCGVQQGSVALELTWLDMMDSAPA